MDLLKNLNINKSTDIYQISPKVIKTAAKNLPNYIALIFIFSNEEGMFPAQLKYYLSTQSMKENHNLTVQTIGQYPSYHYAPKIFENKAHQVYGIC